jgi:single-stranded DNA-binding protein
MIMNIIIVGRLTRDAEVRTLSNDKQVVNFSVAVNDSYKNKQGERVEQVEYFNCAYWISAGVAKALTKGTLVELTGKVSAKAWTGRDGEAHASLNLLTSHIKLHGGGRKAADTVQLALCPNKETLDLLKKGADDEISTLFKNTVDDAFTYAMMSDTQEMETTKGTLFGAYNAVTGYYQNVRSYRDDEAKLQSIVMGGTAQTKAQKAFELCTSYEQIGTDLFELN